tara:strand:+ start:37365 stop:37763 length:399 start_codon:yes stop_codon:yes gene_type:complete
MSWTKVMIGVEFDFAELEDVAIDKEVYLDDLADAAANPEVLLEFLFDWHEEIAGELKVEGGLRQHEKGQCYVTVGQLPFGRNKVGDREFLEHVAEYYCERQCGERGIYGNRWTDKEWADDQATQDYIDNKGR